MRVRHKIKLGDAVYKWRDQLQSEGKAPNTIRVYTNHLLRFWALMRKVARRQDIYVHSITEEHVTQYFLFLSQTTQRSSQNNAINAFRSFIRFCHRRGYMPMGYNPLGERKLAKGRTPPFFLSGEDFPALLDAAEAHHPEDRMIIALMLYTLARKGDVANLQFRRVHWGEGKIELWVQKTRRWLPYAIAPQLKVELERWLGFYAREISYVGSIESFLLTYPEYYLVPRRHFAPQRKTGTPYVLRPELRANALERVVKRACEKIGVDLPSGKSVRLKGVGGHTIRRSGAEAMLRYLARTRGDTDALLLVSEMLGHADIQTTLVYLNRDARREDLNSLLRKEDPFGLSWDSESQDGPKKAPSVHAGGLTVVRP